MTRTLRILFIISLILPLSIHAQDRDDFIRPFFGYYDSQSLTNGIGRATVASGQVVPGKSSNPANLGLHRFSTVQMSFLSGRFSSNDNNLSQMEFGGIYSIMPVKVYRGSLVFGLGVQKEVDFSEAASSADYRYKDEGGIYATEMGFSVECVKDLFVGAEIEYYRGQDKSTNTWVENSSYLHPRYSGFGLSIGFVQRMSSMVLIGASVDLSTSLRVKEELTEWPNDSTQLSSTEKWNYHLKRPLTFHTGGSLLSRYVNVFYELELADWRNLEFSSEEYYESDEVEINNEIQAEMRFTATHHLGMAFHPPWLPVHIYTGYQHLPTPYSGVYTSNKRESFSLGTSYLVNQQFSIHGSYTNYFWKYSGEKENYRQIVFGVSLHY